MGTVKRIFGVFVVLLIIVSLLTGGMKDESELTHTLVNLVCHNDTFEIRGEVYNSTTAWGMYLYKYRLSFFLNQKLVQDTHRLPPLLQYFKDKYGSHATYFSPELTLRSDNPIDNSWAGKVTIYVSSTDFSESEYNNLVDCITDNKTVIATALNKDYEVQPKKRNPEVFHIRSDYNDIAMITYGEPYSNIILNCTAAQADWVTYITPDGSVGKSYPHGFDSLGEIQIRDGKEVLSGGGGGWDADYEYLESCRLPRGEKFFDVYPVYPSTAIPR